jgi:hypothetical protein
LNSSIQFSKIEENELENIYFCTKHTTSLTNRPHEQYHNSV